MREQEPLHARLGGHMHRVGGGRVPPVGLDGELVVGVLPVVDEQVHVLAQLEHGFGDGPAVQRCLVVRHVGDGAPLGLDPEAQGHPGVRDGPGHHLGLPDREVLGPDVDGDQLAAELLHVDREDGRLHRGVQGVLQGALGLGRSVDGQAGPGVVQRAEEGNTQDVVEVQVGEQRRGVHGGSERAHLLVQHVAERAQTGPEVDDERLIPLDVDHQARGVPPVAPVAIPRARARSPHPVERDVHPLEDTRREDPRRGGTFSRHGSAPRYGERHRVRVPGRRARGRTAGPVPARVPRHGPHLALPAPRAGRRGLPGRCALPPRLRPHPDPRRRPLPDRRHRAGRQRVARGPRRRRRRRHRGPRLGGTRHLRCGGPPARPLAPRRATAAVPPTASIGMSLFSYAQLRRSWYMFFFLSPAAEMALPLDDYAFLDGLWRDWSPGYDPAWDVARVKESIGDPDHILAAIGYYRAMWDTSMQAPELADEQAASLQPTPTPTLYLHGRDDGWHVAREHRRAARLPARRLRDGDRRRRRALPPRRAPRPRERGGILGFLTAS